MIHTDALADELSTLLATETRSLVRHVHTEAKPYLTPRTWPIWQRLQQMGRTSEDHARRLSDLIDRLDLPPRSVPFDTIVANYHFMTVESLLPLLIAEKRQQIAAYERAIHHAADEPEVVRELQSLLAENQSQLALLSADAKTLAA